MAESTIGWTDYTYNLWRGCTKYGPGCDHCYAEARDVRYEGGLHWGKGAPRILAAHPTRIAPLKWNAIAPATGKRKVFASSLADVFDEEVDPAWRAMLWDMIRSTTELRWQIVTKRIAFADQMLPPGFPRGFGHVGVIATVVTQKEADRDVPILLDLKARRRVTWAGLSIEPQLGMIDLTVMVRKPSMFDLRLVNRENVKKYWFNALDGTRGVLMRDGRVLEADPAEDRHASLDWVISGGESLQSSHDAEHPPRLYNLAWPRSLRDQCAEAGVAYFQKQLGARPFWLPEISVARYEPDADYLDPVADMWVRLKDRHAGADPDEWPADLRVQQFPEALR